MKEKQTIYAFPQAEVVEIKALQMLCASNTERLKEATPDWSWEEE